MKAFLAHHKIQERHEGYVLPCLLFETGGSWFCLYGPKTEDYPARRLQGTFTEVDVRSVRSAAYEFFSEVEIPDELVARALEHFRQKRVLEEAGISFWTRAKTPTSPGHVRETCPDPFLVPENDVWLGAFPGHKRYQGPLANEPNWDDDQPLVPAVS